jgi:hypothetical protein
MRAFIIRVGRYGVFAFGLISISLLIGTIGYRIFAGLGWLDGFSYVLYDIDRNGTCGRDEIRCG